MNPEEAAEEYMLYDIDKDSIPELFTRKGNCEANYNCDVYSYKNGKVILSGNLGAGHSSFYSDPKENGMMIFWCHLNAIIYSKVSMNEETLVCEVVHSEQVLNGELSMDIDDIVEGTELLHAYSIMLDLPLIGYGTGE